MAPSIPSLEGRGVARYGALMPPTPKPWIEAIHPYVPGKSSGADGRPLVKLSANENPLGTSAAAAAALAGRDGQEAAYPDPDATELRRAIAYAHDLDPDRIVCGFGSDDLLTLAANAYLGPDDEGLHVRYGFSVYPMAIGRTGATVVEARDRDYGTDVDALLAAATPATRLVFVANPNNPTGTFLPAAEIARLHAGLREDVLLVLDGAYAEYVNPADDDGALDLARAADNVLVTRTFSKIHGLAGERVGWATGPAAVVGALNRIRGPFNVTASGQAAAAAAIGDRDWVERSREANRRGRARFAERLRSLGNAGVRVVPSEANFLLVLFEGALTAERAYGLLMEAGVVVRWLPNQGLGHALRITIGHRQAMDRIADVIAGAV